MPPAGRGHREELDCRQIRCLPALSDVNLNVPSEANCFDKTSWKEEKIKFNNVNKIKKNTHSCKADTSVVFCSNNNKTTDQYEVSSETLMFYKRSGFRCRKWLSVEDFPNRREKKMSMLCGERIFCSIQDKPRHQDL